MRRQMLWVGNIIPANDGGQRFTGNMGTFSTALQDGFVILSPGSVERCANTNNSSPGGNGGEQTWMQVPRKDWEIQRAITFEYHADNCLKWLDRKWKYCKHTFKVKNWVDWIMESALVRRSKKGTLPTQCSQLSLAIAICLHSSLVSANFTEPVHRY